MKLTTLAVVTLALGIALGFVVSRSLDGSASAAPPPPADTKVREQNLDGSGFIRVHEQGTANVTGTVDVGNLPAVQDVNVVSATPQTGRLIELGTHTVPWGGAFTTPLVDVSDCQRVTLMAKSSGSSTNASIEYMSPDGTTRIAAPDDLGGTQGWEGGTYSRHNVEIVMPFMSLVISSSSAGTPTDLTAWIWCVP